MENSEIKKEIYTTENDHFGDMRMKEVTKQKVDAPKIGAKTAVTRNYLRLFRFLSFIVFSGIAFYWISEVWVSYFAYPVNTVVTLVKNETF